MLVAAFALLRALSGRQGQVVVRRSEWVEISAALLVTAAVGTGVMLIVANGLSFLVATKL